MAILDNAKLDFLWKRILFGTSKTDAAALKEGPNETIPSLPPILPRQIWADEVPSQPPAATTEVVEVREGATRFQLSADPTSTPNVTWLAPQGDFIPPTFGAGYVARVFIGDPNGGPAARIFPGTPNEEWVFDYASGVLHFPNNVPGAKSATVGTGTVSVQSHGICIEAYRYVGARGVAGGGGDPGGGDPGGPGDPGDLGTMAYQDDDDVDINGGVIRDTLLIRVTVDAGNF